jgi:hypothetical protein
MTRLILLGGPTGVGKSSTLRLLEQRLPGSALLDADDVWRVSADLALDGTRPNALGNVIGVMRGYFEAGCQVGILAWVFARAELYAPVIDGLRDLVDSVSQIYLVASPDALRERLSARGDLQRHAYSLSRLELIQALPFPKIDTTDLPPGAAAQAVLRQIEESQAI